MHINLASPHIPGGGRETEDPLEITPRPVVCECPSHRADISHIVSLDRIYVTALACKDSDVVCRQAKRESLWNKLEVYTLRCFCKAFKIADFDPSDPKE